MNDGLEIENDEPDEMPSARETKPLTIDIPIPTTEQVCAELVRQILRERGASELKTEAREAFSKAIDAAVEAIATPLIESMLANPIRPTDGFGNATGEPTTMAAVIAARIEGWCKETVDRDGATKKADYYDSKLPSRMAWMIGKVINGELQQQVDAEVKKIVATLKEQAQQNIAQQIAARVAGMVFK